MDAALGNTRIILEEKTANDYWTIELDFTPINAINVAHNERTIGTLPTVDVAPIVPVQCVNLTPNNDKQSITQATHINIVPLLFAGLMISSAFFSGGYIIGKETTLNQLKMERATR